MRKKSNTIMQTYLIVSLNQTFINGEIEKKREKLNVSPFNIHEISPTPSIGINTVRNLREILSRKPFGGGERLIIIRGMEKATVEAANALLKILEEPPPGTFIILTSASLDQLLPTVVSRCQIISERKFQPTVDLPEIKNITRLTEKILTSSPGERILLSQKVAKSRDEALQLLDNFLVNLDQFLRLPLSNEVSLSAKEAASLIKKVLAAKSYIGKNVSYKATLDVLFLGFPKRETS